MSPMLCGACLEHTCIHCVSHSETSMDFLRFYIKMFMLRRQPTCGCENSEGSRVPFARCSPAARKVNTASQPGVGRHSQDTERCVARIPALPSGSRSCFPPSLFPPQTLLFSHVPVFAADKEWTAARKPPLSSTVFQSLLKLMSVESMMPSNHLILCLPPPPAFNLPQHQGLFQ